MPQKCIICLNESCNLISISEPDSNNLKLIYKLNFCVPEVDWIEDYQICDNCIIQLETACAFRDLCLGSLTNRKLRGNILDYYKGNCFQGLNQTNLDLKCEEYNVPDDCSPLRGDLCNINIAKAEFTCFHCGQHFARKLLLVAHIRTEHNMKLRECQFCRKVHSNDKCDEIKCGKCAQFFTTENSLIVHSKSCNYDASTEKAIQLNYNQGGSVLIRKGTRRGRKKLDPLSNTCKTCGMIFNTHYLAKRHMRNVHATEKNYECEICQQRFASPVYLNAHKRYHTGERSHICSFCGKGFITGSDLYHHEKIHQNKRAYKCDKCPKAFNTSSDLHKHKLCVHIDRGEWKYVCTYCNRRFPLKTNLDAHTKTHTGERNFACHLCNHKCVNRSVLLRHITSHSNVRLFKCNVCVMEYKYQKSLDVHMAKAHGIGDAKIPERIKKYFCHICPKSYFANNKLQKHIRTHTGERPFSCQICDKRFIDKSYIKQHLKTAHNVTFNDMDM